MKRITYKEYSFSFPPTVIVVFIFACLLLSGNSAHTHNGAVALAYPVENITIDGDFSDWPEHLPRYPVNLIEYGELLENSADLVAYFRIAYNPVNEKLYFAIETQDDSIVIDRANPMGWNSQDGCEVYFDPGHGIKQSTAMQYTFYGDTQNSPSVGAIERGWQQSENGARFEWSIDIAKQYPGEDILNSGRSLSFDISVGDKDDDGSFSWVAWGKSAGKLNSVNRRGDLILLKEGQGTGEIRGKVQWESGGSLNGVKVRFHSTDKSLLWGQVETDANGEYQIDLPEGNYVVELAGRGKGSGETVEVRGGQTAIKNIFLGPPSGLETVAGQGKSIRAGVGILRRGWHTYSMQDGLSSDRIVDMVEDHNGIIWIATDDSGICRFDGEFFTTYTTNDGLPENSIQTLMIDSSGILWIGMQNGDICQFDGNTFTTYSTNDGLSGSAINALMEDSSGKLWIATHGGGLCMFDKQTLVTYTTNDGLPTNVITGISEDSHGNLWIITPLGLCCKNGETFTTFTTDNGLLTNEVTSLIEDSDGSLLISTHGGHLCRLVEGHITPVISTSLLPENRVSRIVMDSDGIIWLGTSLEGLKRYDGNDVVTLNVSEGLAGFTINTLLIDHEGTLWAGTYQGGISRFSGKTLTSFTTEDNFPNIRMMALLEDSQDKLWIATDGEGVSRYDGKNITSYTINDGLPSNRVWDVMEDREGVIWAATDKGLCRFEGDRFTTNTSLARAGLLRGLNIWDILEDENRKLWFGTQSGLTCYDGETLTTFSTNDGLIYPDVRKLLEDSSGNIWLATIFGLSCYDGSSFTNYTIEDGLHSNNVTALTEDNQGRIWIGTDTGVDIFDGEHFEGFTTKDGLTNNSVRSLLQDSDGVMWIGTDNGISRFDGVVFQSLHGRDGIAGRSAEALMQDHTGSIWIGTQSGLTRYVVSHSTPPIMITDVVTNKRHGPVKEIAMSTVQPQLTIEFRGISFKTRPEAMIYRYRLVGYENEWQLTSRRAVDYTDLPAGKYVFEVRTIDRDLGYSKRVERVYIMVRWPYARIALSITVLLLMAIIIILLGQVFVRNRELNHSNIELKNSETRTNALFEFAPDGIVIVDQSGAIVKINTQVEKYFGYEKSELIDQPIEILVPEHVRDKHVGLRNKYLDDPKMCDLDITLELIGQRKDGTLFPVAVSLSPVEQDDGFLVMAAVRDITKRKKAEKAIQESEEKLSSYVDNAPNGIFVVDEKGKYLDVNREACILLGYSRKELLEFSIWDIVAPVSSKDALNEFDVLLENGKIYGEYLFKHSDGHEFYMSVDASRVSPIEFIGFCSDITERKHVEEELKERMDELERFSRLTINREEKMIQLKEEINTLLGQIGKDKKYKIIV